jgi:hypothetical protein
LGADGIARDIGEKAHLQRTGQRHCHNQNKNRYKQNNNRIPVFERAVNYRPVTAAILGESFLFTFNEGVLMIPVVF